jgi:MerR family transcriptional regulator, heat shock protein HspR
MEEMNRQMQSFVEYVRTAMLTRFQQAQPGAPGAIVPIRRPIMAREGGSAKTGAVKRP